MTNNPPQTQPPHDQPQQGQPAEGMSTGAKVGMSFGIGCGVIGLIAVIGVAVVTTLAVVLSNSKSSSRDQAREKIAERRRAKELKERGPDIILISIDTLRADHLGCYGGTAKTPNIDRLAAEGVRFENCFTPNPLTLPAHTSMLSGTSPIYHQVRDNTNQTVPTTNLVLLQEELVHHGYYTGGFVSSAVMAKESGIARGFDHYDDEIGRASAATTLRERNAAQTLGAAQRWIDSRDEKDPYFAFVHLFDPHFPYFPPDGQKRGLKPSREFTYEALRPNYDAEIEYVDAQLGLFLEALKEKGRLDNARIVLTADHGEDLGERGEVTHGYTVYDGTTHVPMIIWESIKEHKETVSEFVSLNDVFPTIMELAGKESSKAAAGQQQGRSLLAPQQKRLLYIESHYGYLYNGWAKLRATRGDKGLVVIGGGLPEVVEATKGSLDGSHLLDAQKTIQERLSHWYATGMSASGEGTGVEHYHTGLDHKDAENLGYPVDKLGVLSFDKETLTDSKGLPSPHKMIHAIGTQQKASMAFTAGRRATALAILDDYRKSTEGDPGMLFHNFYARIAIDTANEELALGKSSVARDTAKMALRELRAAAASARAVKSERGALTAELSLHLLELRLAEGFVNMEAVHKKIILTLAAVKAVDQDKLLTKAENLELKARITIARAKASDISVFLKLAEEYKNFSANEELLQRIREGSSIIAPFN